MPELVGFLVLVVACGLTYVAWRRVHAQRIARRRLGASAESEGTASKSAASLPSARVFVRRHWWAPLLVGAVAGLAVHWLAGWAVLFAVALALAMILLGLLVEDWRVQRRTALIEAQLADGLDLMVGALGAGVSVMQALEAATRETRAPLKPQLEHVLGRIRLGDDPQAVLRSLDGAVPLPTFRLFTSALSVHWEVGGSLTGPLAVVGRAIRDRIEMARRVRSVTAQGRFSVLAVMGVTYFVALVVWRTDPDRMRQFLATSLGEWLVAAAIVLQAVGVLWTARLSRMQF
jgi:tight adherence protein B